jgi:hypothetical protein
LHRASCCPPRFGSRRRSRPPRFGCWSAHQESLHRASAVRRGSALVVAAVRRRGLGAGRRTRNRRIGHLLSAAVRLSSPQPSPRRRHLATATAAIAAARFVLLVGQTSKRCSGEVMSARRPAAASPQAPPRHRHRLDRNSAVRATVGQTSKRCSGEVMSARRPAAASPQPPPPPRRNLIKGHLTLAFDLNRSPLQQKKLRVRDPARPRALLSSRTPSTDDPSVDCKGPRRGIGAD